MPYSEKSMTKSKWKKTLFIFLLIIIGISLFFISEKALQFFHMGEKYSLVDELDINHEAFYRINRSFPKKYFRSMKSAPEFRDVLIPAHKKMNEKRVIALGGSTTFGFPYSYNITFPDMLEDLLNRADSEYEWRVINLSTSAINSFSVTDILEHAPCLEPDAIVLYMGHNEFYGAFGSASTEKGFNSYVLTHLFMNLQESYLFQNMLSLFQKNISQNQDSEDPLMARVVRERHIPYGSSLYMKTYLNFIKNLERIQKTTEKLDIPVYIGTLVSNERSQMPFASEFIDEDLDQFSLYKEFESYLIRDDTIGVKLWLEDLYVWEPTSAIFAYCMGKYYDWINMPDSATAYYIKARDQDVLRFRASSDWNRAIQQIAMTNTWEVVPVEKAFYNYSAPHAPGNNLFHEHVHPNIKGYMLMAETFFKEFLNSNFCQTSLPVDSILSDFEKEYPITPFEIKAGELTIQKLMSRWPFTSEYQQFTFNPSNTTEHYAWEYLNKNITWGKANQALTEYHINRNDIDLAIRYVQSIKAVTPYSSWPYTKLARLYLTMQRPDLALNELKGIDHILDDPEIWYLEGMIYFQMNENDFAIYALNKTRSHLLKESSALSHEIIQQVYLMLAQALMKSSRTEEAQRIIEEANNIFHVSISL